MVDLLVRDPDVVCIRLALSREGATDNQKIYIDPLCRYINSDILRN